MNNIFGYLRPKESDKGTYDSIIKKYSLENTVNSLWYHSAGRDFQSLYFSGKRNNLAEITGGKPDLFIYTDMDKNIIEKIRQGKLFNFGDKIITVNSYIELDFEGDIKDYFPSSINKDSIDYKADYYSVFLFDLNLGENESDVPLLYFVWENTAFLNAFVIERNIKIKYFQKPREYGFGGGWIDSQIYLLFFLGLMGTEYLFLENAHNYTNSLVRIKDIITEDKVLYEKFMCTENNFPDVKRIGTTHGNWFPPYNDTRFYDYYNIMRLFKNTNVIPNMTFDQRISSIMSALRIR